MLTTCQFCRSNLDIPCQGVSDACKCASLDHSAFDGQPPTYENGSWWWYDPVLCEWLPGCAPQIGAPFWAKARQVA